MDGLRRLSGSDRRSSVGEIRAEHPRAYEKSSVDEDTRLLAGYRAGRTVVELAVDHQRQPSAIESRLRKLALGILSSVPAPPGERAG